VPRPTLRDVVFRLNRAVNEILAQPDIIEQVKREGGEIVPMSPEHLTSFVRSESARYADLLQEEFCSRLLFGGCLGFGTLADRLCSDGRLQHAGGAPVAVAPSTSSVIRAASETRPVQAP